MLEQSRRLIEISRPLGWIAAPLIMLLAFFNFGSSNLNLLLYLELFLYSFPFCLFLYGINDMFDRDTDRQNERKKTGSAFIDGKALEENIDSFLKKYSIFLGFLLVSIPLIRQNIVHFAGTIILLLFSYLYSAEPYRLKARAPLDSLSNVMIYSLGPFLIGLSYTNASIPWNFILWLSSATFAVHAFTTLMDYTPDKKAGLNTFAVKFGKKKTVLLSSVIFFLLFLIPVKMIELRIASLLLGMTTILMFKKDLREKHAAKTFYSYLIIINTALILITSQNLHLI